ncbi:MAG: glycosyltransferase family 2 protein [Candidatus Magasanikbacteria bacterium]|nr:glycosyltransferase family 2 protein [Candidatus Magasanikbacteria bacterium]
MELSIITVTWSSEKKIVEQIKSVAEACKSVAGVEDVENVLAVEFEQIVVDNASTDQTAALIKKNFPDVKLIENRENVGFGAANNQGVKISRGEFILFLNPDMRLDPGSMLKMLAWMRKKKDVGIASCKLVDAEGKFNLEAGPRRFPKVWEQVCLLLKLQHIFPILLNNYLMKDFNSDLEQEVDSVRGSLMLVRRELVEKLGWGFDPRYFIWFEDVDLCREAKRSGFKVVYTPIISGVDYFGQSFKQRDSVWKQKVFSRSMLTYFQKWEPWWRWIWIWLARPCGLLIVKFLNEFSLKVPSPRRRGTG